MPLPKPLITRLRLPVIAAPMFIVSGPALVTAQCKAGIVGSFPALNARSTGQLDEWLAELTQMLGGHESGQPGNAPAPFAVNQIVHSSNDRLDRDVELCVRYRVPIVITSLRPPADVVREVHGYGGLVFHDVINRRHAEKAAAQGVDGIVAVCAGAGGHAGTVSPFAMVKEIREVFDGTLILSGAMSTGADILSAQVMGADLAYMGTRFIATHEANASDTYKQMVVDGRSEDIVYTPVFSGVAANYLRSSIVRAGLDPASLPQSASTKMSFVSGEKELKAWKDIWSAGHSVSGIHEVQSVATLVSQMEREYIAAEQRLQESWVVSS